MDQRLVGRLIYFPYTRLNIAYEMGVISQVMQNPKEVYLQVAYKVLYYPKGTSGKGIMLKKNDRLLLETYTNANLQD